MTQVRTRFAPSPTGMLHIGGARTALFNLLLAKSQGGQFLLRIEDTDKARNTQENIDAILEGLNWLGVAHDEDVVFQSKNEQAHKDAALKLLTEGKAYKCYCTSQELDAMRAEQEANKQKPRYDSRCRAKEGQDIDKPYTVRLKVPADGTTKWDDAVQGVIDYPNKELDDFILLRSDGSPTYNLAVVVDDHDMGMSHIIRGDDHINNTPKQILIYKALGYDVPTFAHIPLIHGDDGKKMSKRHGAVGVMEYQKQGFLPQAVCNYLMQLSWSHQGGEEIFSIDEASKLFELKRIGKGAATFNTTKLKWLNAQYMRNLPPAELMVYLKPLLPNATDKQLKRIELALPALLKRAETLTEVAEGAEIFLTELPLSLDEKAASIMDNDAKERLDVIANTLEKNSSWQVESLEESIKQILTEHGYKMPQVGMPVRAALVGTTQAPGLGDLLAAFGKEESLKRLRSLAKN